MYSITLEQNGLEFFACVPGFFRGGDVVGFYIRDDATKQAILAHDPRIWEVLERMVIEVEDLRAICFFHQTKDTWRWMKCKTRWPRAERQELREECQAILKNKYATADDKVVAQEILATFTEQQVKGELIRNRRAQFAVNRDQLCLQLIAAKGYRCAICGSADDLTLDHINPLSKGGSDALSNLQFLCQIHNSQKGDRLTVGVTT